MKRIRAVGLGLSLLWQTAVLAQEPPGPTSARPQAVASADTLPPEIARAGSTPELHDEMGDIASGGSGDRFYVRTEYLLWWIKSTSNPVLAATGPASLVGSIHTNVGSLGAPGTVVLNGGAVDYGPESGFRVTAGFWLDDCHHKALETTFFSLGPQNKQFNDNSGVNAVIARPFFDQNFGVESAELTAAPGLATGSIVVRNSARLWGLEENLRCNLCCGCNSRLDFLAGLRYLELDEGLTIGENVLTGPDAPFPPGTHATVYDEFSTRNRFLGGQVGLDYETHRGSWFLDVRGKAALGNTEETLKIVGSQTVTPPGGPTTTYTGGLLALPSNIGIYHRDRFTVVPELTLNVGYEFTENVRAYVGYNFLYWSGILSPGAQIDRVLNVNQIPNATPPAFPPVAGPVRPVAPLKQSDFQVQGLNFGLEFRF
jgi:hypothetical protein